MSRYRNDPRVTRTGTGFTVTTGDTDYRILPNDTLGWGIYTGPNLDLVIFDSGVLALGFHTADKAIKALIGAPR